METTLQVKAGKYTFVIKETSYERDGEILFTTLHLCTFKTPTCRRFMGAKVGSLCAFQMRKGVKMGGDYQDCINVSIDYRNNKPISAKMPHIMYDEECAYNEPPTTSTTNKTLLEKGNGSKIMLQSILTYIKQKYPTLTEVKYDDMSSIDCATDNEIKNAVNRKRGTNVKPMSLYNLSIAYNGQTWYEKYFNGRMQNAEKHAKYRERVNILLNSKPVDFNDFIRITNVSKDLWDELFEYYKSAETYSNFFNAIPKIDRCRLLQSWIDAFMKHNLKGVFSNNDWIIPLGVQGGKKRTQRKKRNQRGYIPDGIRLNQRRIKPTKNLIRTADSNSSWSIIDKEINPSPEGADLNIHRFKSAPADSHSSWSLTDKDLNFAPGGRIEIFSGLNTSYKNNLGFSMDEL